MTDVATSVHPDAVSVDNLIELSEGMIDANRLNAAEELLFHAVRQDKMRHRGFFLLGEVFLKKADTQNAERMFGVARTLAPEEYLYQERLELVAQLRAAAELEKWKSANALRAQELRRFDFAILPLPRGGSRMWTACLNAHPEIFVPLRGKTDEALLNKTEKEMLAGHQELFESGRFKVAGLVTHEYLGPVSDLDVSERIAGIVDQRRFFLSVRDPIHMFRAHFNHCMFARTSNYNFARVGINWVGEGTSFAEMTAGNWLPPQQGTPERLPEFGKAFFDKILGRGLYYDVVEAEFLRYFESCDTVDLDALVQDRAAELGRLFGLLGVRQDFNHPYFEVPLANPADCAMQYNPVILDVFGTPVRFRLAYQGFSDIVVEYEDLVEVATIAPDVRFDEAGIAKHPVCLAANASDWLRVPRDVRRKIIDGRLAQPVLEEAIFPFWLDCFRQFRDVYRPHRWGDEVPPLFLDAIRDMISGSLAAFLKRHPRHEKNWPNLDLIFRV